MMKSDKTYKNLSCIAFCKVNNNRHYTYIENLVGFIDRIIEKKASGIFIAMDEKALSTTDLVMKFIKFIHRKRVFIQVT